MRAGSRTSRKHGRQVHGREVREIQELYFAYGSNMNLEQMEFRCPNAEVVGNVTLKDYRLAFRGRPYGSGVATVIPEKGSQVEGVLWSITPDCEMSLDRYEGYPHLYGKEKITVQDAKGNEHLVMVYTINEPYKSCPLMPSDYYLKGILEGCRENRIPTKSIMDAVKRTRAETKNHGNKETKKQKYPTR